MRHNIGNEDRLIRVVVGLGILSLTIIGPQSIWGLVGLIPLATAVIGWCPPYSILGINTRRS